MLNYFQHIYQAIFSSKDVFEAVRAYGYFFVLLGTFFEGEIILLLGGFASYLGILKLPLVALFGFLGAVAGDNFWYFIGSTGGIKFLEKYGKYIFITEQRILKARKYFEAHGKKTVFFSRFIFGTRITTAIFAGAVKMSKIEFLKSNIAGAAVWALTISMLGFIFGKSLDALKMILHRTELALLILVLAAIILFILRVIISTSKNKEKNLEP